MSRKETDSLVRVVTSIGCGMLLTAVVGCGDQIDLSKKPSANSPAGHIIESVEPLKSLSDTLEDLGRTKVTRMPVKAVGCTNSGEMCS